MTISRCFESKEKYWMLRYIYSLIIIWGIIWKLVFNSFECVECIPETFLVIVGIEVYSIFWFSKRCISKRNEDLKLSLKSEIIVVKIKRISKLEMQLCKVRTQIFFTKRQFKLYFVWSKYLLYSKILIHMWIKISSKLCQK